MTNFDDSQSRDNYNLKGSKGHGGIPFYQYPGQKGVIIPNPTLGQTNFGGVTPNMPYGPVYAFPSFPFQHGANQSRAAVRDSSGVWAPPSGYAGR